MATDAEPQVITTGRCVLRAAWPGCMVVTPGGGYGRADLPAGMQYPYTLTRYPIGRPPGAVEGYRVRTPAGDVPLTPSWFAERFAVDDW